MLVNESIDKYLYGPSEEEIERRIEDADFDPADLLWKSTKAGYLKGVKKALKQGVSKDFINIALSRAAGNGHLDVVKYLVEYEDADMYENEGLALRYAIRNNHKDVIKYLKRKMDNRYVLKYVMKTLKNNMNK